ncbi:MAG: Obg family GTPase, partial [Planctomycetia bacterium]
GKSTLLSRVSKAQPEIADYPFTTKTPNLGICQLDEDHRCVIADIPGLIEGAHAGIGLGHEFLRHVERTKSLIHLVECLPLDGSSPVRNYRTIRNELGLYSPKLAAKPELVVLSKAELLDPLELLAIQTEMAAEIGKPVATVSAVTGAGLRDLISSVRRQWTEEAETTAAARS